MKNSFLLVVALGLFTPALPVSAQTPRSQVTKELRQMLHAGQFEALEAFAANMLKKTDGMGGRYADSFYFCESFQKPLSTKTGDLAWTEHFGELEKWAQQYPESVYPRVALARSLCSYFACLMKERSTAKRLFEEIGSQWRSEAWGNQGVFEQWRKWAGP
jgi:hypothetical protein